MDEAWRQDHQQLFQQAHQLEDQWFDEQLPEKARLL